MAEKLDKGFVEWAKTATGTQVRHMAHLCWMDGISILGTIEVLEAFNETGVRERVNNAGGGQAGGHIVRALMDRFLLLTARAFDYPREGDQHARAVVALLRLRPDLYGECIACRLPGELERALNCFDRLMTFGIRDRIKHYRDKAIAHSSELDPAIDIPLIGPAMKFSRYTACVCEMLARATHGNRAVMEKQMLVHRQSARNLWAALADTPPEAQLTRLIEGD